MSDGEIDRMDEVDADPHAHEATEGDEETVLKGLYGEPDQYGIYRGVES
jgi:hypothetical protein